MLLEKLGAGGLRDAPDVYLVAAGERNEFAALQLAERLRDAWPGLRLQFNLGGGAVKTQFKRADKSGAAYALILGEEEIARGVVAIKDLRGGRPQEECATGQLSERIGKLLGLTEPKAE